MLTNARHSVRTSVAALLGGLALLAAPLLAPPARAQYRMDKLPSGLNHNYDVPTITPKPNAKLPLDLQFTRSDGKVVKLGSVFHQGRPIILSMVYFSCPNLCTFNQEGLVEAVKEGPRGLSLGKDYDILVVSIDPDDTPASAETKRRHYVDLMNRNPDTEKGVIYLTGSEANIKQLAETVGFGYHRNYNSQDAKFSHSTGIFICTPDGRLSQTIQGVTFEPDTLHHALVEASNGRIGSGLLSFALCCGAVHYNPKTGRYEQNPYFYVGTATGLLSILGMGCLIFFLTRGGSWRKGEAAPESDATSPPDTQ